MATSDKATVEHIETHFLAGLGRIAEFWGFPRALGSAYAAIYLSPTPISLDDLVRAVGVTKGGLSGHVRALERLGMIHRETRLGDRKDYYRADTDFWGVIRRVLREREQREFDRALRTVSECVAMTDDLAAKPNAEMAFVRERLLIMQRFFDRLDQIVALLLAIENIAASPLAKLFGLGKAAKKARS